VRQARSRRREDFGGRLAAPLGVIAPHSALRVSSFIMRICRFCGTPLDEKMEVHRSSTCPACGKDLKICLNCRFYSKGIHNDCLETSAEPVRDKDRSNFCDYFQFKDTAGKGATDRKERARDDFRRLFGDGK
jgi:hypothetical protein